jgi:RNA 3'-terminal phosphate cyclase (ATP)
MVRLDGATGEGGGQILRTALSLSMITGQEFRIENIRAGRAKPGLLRQHLTAVLAAAEVSGASVDGAVLGSKILSFAPGAVSAGRYKFAVGTAGSATLVLQTLLPALMLAEGQSVVSIEGGTHNMAAPPFDFLEKTFLPIVGRMGPTIAIRLERYGFYPAGGGCISVEIDPVKRLAELHLPLELDCSEITATAIVANLPRHIAARELAVAAERLEIVKDGLETIETRNSVGPGNVLMVECRAPEAVHVFTGFGKVGVSAETVAGEAISQARKFLSCKVSADEHLADQLLLPMALSGGGSFSTSALSPHSHTNMGVIIEFLGTNFEVTELSDGEKCEVRVSARR